MTSIKVGLDDDEKAVSAIIGVLLMVVITVVLAASIAMFSFNFMDSKPNANIAAVHVVRVDSTHIVLKYMGCLDNNNILFDDITTPNGHYGVTPTGCYGSFNVTVNGQEVSNFVQIGNSTCTSSVGSVQYFSPVPENSEVTVTINYKDGTKYAGWEGIVH
jgi:flagellin-like protein